MIQKSIVSINIKEMRELENWKPISLPDFEETHDAHIIQKHSQEQSFTKLVNKPYSILNKPTGSGKSIDMCYIIRKKIEDNQLLKAIISVPQTAIAHSFTTPLNLKYPDGSVLDWMVGWDYCNDIDGAVQGIINFLKRESSIKMPSDRVLITTHAALVRAFQQNKELFTNVLLAIDEAHHIQLDENILVKNENGHLVEYAIREKDKNIQLLLATATFFRGDRLGIIPDQYIEIFARYDLPYDSYLKYECQYLETFDYEFCLYKVNYKEVLMKKFENNVSKFIGYIPYVGSSYSIGDKYKDVFAYYCAIAQSNSPIIKNNDNGTVSVFRGDKEYIGIDLMEEENRDIKKKYIDDAHRHSDNSKLDFIIALNVFKEGANWKWAEQSFMIGFKNSLTEVLQSGIGRILRDASDKKHVSVCHIIPLTFDPENKAMYWDKYNDYLKAIFICMLLEKAFAPSLKPKQKQIGKNGGGNNTVGNLLLNAVRDENELIEIHKDIHNNAIMLMGRCLSTKEFENQFIKMTEGVLKCHGVTKNKTAIANQIMSDWKSMTAKFHKMNEGLDSSSIDYDAVVGSEIMGFSFRLFSADQGKDAFETLRKKIEERKSLPITITHPEIARQAIAFV